MEEAVGLIAASSSFTRYKLEEKPDKAFLNEVPERLKRHAMVDIDNTTEERSYGWTNIDDMLDTQWVKSPPEKGEFFGFSLRLDTRKISPAVTKKHRQIAEAAFLNSIDDPDRKFISKDRRKELHEQVELKLRTKTWPVPAVFDVAWNIRTHTIFLATTNAKIREMFEDLFALTFELKLEPQTPFFLASTMRGEEVVAKLENLEPSQFA